MLKRVELVPRSKVEYKKKIAIIYNPNSGKKINVRKIIEEKIELSQHSIRISGI